MFNKFFIKEIVDNYFDKQHIYNYRNYDSTFYIMLSHSNLFVYYQKMFAMGQHHKYSMNELDELMPYERDLYFDMLLEFIKKKEEQSRN